MMEHGQVHEGPPLGPAYCAKCGATHRVEFDGCDGLRGGWPPDNATIGTFDPPGPANAGMGTPSGGKPSFDIPATVARWNTTPGAVVHPDLQKAVDKAAADFRTGIEFENLPPDNVTVGVFDPNAPAGIRTTPGGVIHEDPPGPANAGMGSLAHQEGGALHPEPCTYIGAGGLIKIEVQPAAPSAQLRQARRFLDALIDLEGKAP